MVYFNLFDICFVLGNPKLNPICFVLVLNGLVLFVFICFVPENLKLNVICFVLAKYDPSNEIQIPGYLVDLLSA